MPSAMLKPYKAMLEATKNIKSILIEMLEAVINAKSNARSNARSKEQCEEQC